MEKEKAGRVKELFLAGFVLLCAGLIFALWFQAFVEDEAEIPYFYREAPGAGQSIQPLSTSPARPALSPSAAPSPAAVEAVPLPTEADGPPALVTPNVDN
jgi:hypothetical protein